MAQQTELAISSRTVMGKATKQLRRAGIIPANISGHKETPIPVQFDAHEFEVLRRTHRLRHVLSLRMADAAPVSVLVRHVEHDPVTGKVLHVDFSRVSLNEKIESKAPLQFVGTAPGVSIQGGVLLHLTDALAVSCRVDAIVESIEVDVSSLTDIDSTLYARDIKLPDGYELTTDPEEPVVKVIAPRTEEPQTTTAEATPEEAATPNNNAE